MFEIEVKVDTWLNRNVFYYERGKRVFRGRVFIFLAFLIWLSGQVVIFKLLQ
jgi:hypothetical protein